MPDAAQTIREAGCSLCQETGGRLLWENDCFRIVAIMDDDWPGYLRIISQRHVREMTDFNQQERHMLFELLIRVETLMKKILQPHKINIASLGNLTPHQHWHVIGRWADDACFPGSIWSVPTQKTKPVALSARHEAAAALFAAIEKL